VNPARLWAVFVAMGLVTLALRASFLVLQDRVALPAGVQRALKYVPPAILAAIVAPALLAPGPTSLGPVDARLPAAVVATIVAWRTRSVLATLTVGMVTLWLVSAVGRGVTL
jgi:branched-subunit amino acid transport protein